MALLGTPTDYPTGLSAAPAELVAGDFDADGILDLRCSIATALRHRVGVDSDLSDNGDGTFSSAGHYAAAPVLLVEPAW